MLWVIALWGCSPDTPSEPEPGDPPGDTDTEVAPVDTGTPPEPTTPGVDRYDPDHVTTVVAELSDGDWDGLTQEARLYYELLLGPDCFEGPVADVFSWYPGSVSVDGETLDEVGFRKKGLIGSMSWTRPSLKVDTDRFVAGQELADGTEHLTLNNNNQDPTRVHTCLAYEVFARAGVAAPRCAFATVQVNGTDLGVYSNVEPIKNAFLRDRFGSDAGDLYEGTLSDFNDDYLVTFDIKSDGSTLQPLQELADALLLDDATLMPRLEEILDVDGFITEWAVEGLIGHWDGYAQGANNFYVYHDPSDGRLRFIPWGADAVFEDPASESVFTASLLVQRLWNHPEGQQRYLAESQRLLDEVWDEAWLQSEVDRMEGLVTPHLLDPAGTADGIDAVRAFVDGRRAGVQAALDAPPDRPPYEKIKTCVDPIGSVSATFSTQWDTLEDDAFAFPTTLDADAWGRPLPQTYTGSVAGLDAEGTRLIAVIGVNFSFTELVQVILLLPEDLEPGVWPIDIAAVPGFVVTTNLVDPYAESVVEGLIGGELVLDEADYSPGGAISGSIEGILIPSFF